MHYVRVKKHGNPSVVLHAGRLVQDLPTRFWAKVDKNGPIPSYRPDLGPCWLWTAAPTDKGYGTFRVGGRNGKGVPAHRQAYELVIGPIPDGLELDHLCRVTLCVRPTHVEPVTRLENWRRGYAPSAISVRLNACKRGHPYEGANLLLIAGGRRFCRTCWNARRRSYRARVSARLGRPPRNGAKTECIRGHPFDDANTLIMPAGNRQCRACNKARSDARIRPSRARSIQSA